MELFDKIYNCYYQIVSCILKESSSVPITKHQMQVICDQYGFLESGLSIIPKLTDGTWDLLKQIDKDHFQSKISHQQKLPLTALQKSWIRSLISDPRFQLFFSDSELNKISEQMTGIEPLYDRADFCAFDQYQDGDPFGKDNYRQHFQILMNAIKNNQSVMISYQSPKRGGSMFEFLPCRIQYSEKDNKFRALGLENPAHSKQIFITVNISRIQSVEMGNYRIDTPFAIDHLLKKQLAAEPVVIEISGERNSLERCMLQFSNYVKQTVYDEERKLYICSIYYNQQEETELLIQILSFGPVIKVLGHKRFLAQVKKRIRKQHQLLFPIA